MINPNIISAKTGEALPLDSYSSVEDILACPANIASLCICIVELAKERKLWLEPNKAMIQAGLAEVQRIMDEIAESGMYPADMTDSDAEDSAVYILQAMASKHNK